MASKVFDCAIVDYWRGHSIFMAKRFTDTQKWQDEWFMDLPAKYKLLWVYMLDHCDHAGIWKVNLKLAEFHIGENLNMGEAETLFSDRILSINGNWFIKKFIAFQYGGLKLDNVGKSVKKILDKYNINYINVLSGAAQGLPRGCPAPKDKDKDKAKDKVNSIIVSGKKFQYNEVVTLPSNYTRSIQEQLYTLRGERIDEGKITDLWEGFRLEKITGDIYYSSEKDIYLHFVNWIKKQKFTNTTTPKNEQRNNKRKEYATRYAPKNG